MRAALLTLLSHWRRHPGQLAALLLGLVMATALFCAVQAINAEARASYASASARLGAGALPSISGPGGGPVPVETYAALRRAGWPVTPVIEGVVQAGEDSIRLLGIEPLTAPGDMLPAGETGNDGLGLISGASLVLSAPDVADAARSLNGIDEVREASSLPPGEIVADISVAARLLGAGTSVSRLLLTGPAPGPLGEAAPGLILSRPTTGDDLARLTDSFHLNLTAFGLLAFAVGLFIVHGTLSLAFEQRRAMLRTLRALGLPLRTALALMLGETLALALVAGAAGVAAGYLVAGVLLPDVAATLGGLYGAEVPGTLAFRPGWALGGLALAGFGTSLAAASGLAGLARMPLLQGAVPRAWVRGGTGALAMQAAAGGLLMLAGFAAVQWGQSLTSGFIFLGGLLLGAALILPAALALILAGARRLARGPVSEWFWADTGLQARGLSLAMMALLLAVAANVGVSTMVGSFRQTFTGWLDQRLAAELYVAAETEAEATRLAAWLEGRADAVLPIRSAEAELGGAPGAISGVVDDPTYRENWPLLAESPGAWDRLAAGEAALVNEQLARRTGLSVGDPVALGPDWSLPIAGIYSDYGNPSGEAMVSLPLLEARRAGAVTGLRFGVRTPEAEALVAELREFGLPPSRITRQEEIKAASLRIFERTFAVTGALGVLTLGVAGFAILTGLLTLATMRLPQLAPVWALGLGRRRLAILELVRAALLAGITFVLALPLGLALAWALLALVNVAAFGWRLPMDIFPGQWLWLLVSTLAAALIAAAIPARKLWTAPPARLLATFSAER
ncbi:FtsX-like permease family protein [Roseicyclus sp. F158]|uniref:FtsX-like permease family protein n=1 Tax=Tropicimonas omnivorans TaxID=3075590 RepID=A0ABU3DFN2_9RHOB|nr:FtsX-like permease family protein [Roseicyclus sp. F158]MDT0682521.1 FtsX-like permease family protein [Roseicyclus sp. F158]